MKKRFTGIAVALLSICLTACGGLSGKVKQEETKIEVASTFNVSNAFECKEGVSITIKSGEEIDTSSIGNKTAIFVVSDGNNTEDIEYTFEVVDTQPPEIDVNNITVYKGSEFDPIKYATCIDNSGEKIIPNVESNDVDTNTEGSYSVKYKAVDSAGNASEKVVTVEVLAIDTAEDVMDLVDEYLTKNGYSSFKYNKNVYDAVFVTVCHTLAGSVHARAV